MKIGLVKTCDFLPYTQAEADSCWLHISKFIEKQKVKPSKKNLLVFKKGKAKA